jgi:hypothetical protein
MQEVWGVTYIPRKFSGDMEAASQTQSAGDMLWVSTTKLHQAPQFLNSL